VELERTKMLPVNMSRNINLKKVYLRNIRLKKL